MKHRLFIGLFVLLALAACHRPVETQNFASLPSTTSPELSAIDSLMWQRPDSALACLLPCFDTCCAAEHDRHYAHLLLSELLYKNDYAQTNRAELQDAVVYFDSLMQAPEPVEGPSKKQNVFLAARAHYINGVGYYEQDSAVPACQEYLKALETMEEGFEEKELVGKKAQFMALTYTHLTGLFSDQYLHEQAIYFGKEALRYYQKYNAFPQHKAWILNEIGSHFDMMRLFDSADFYYNTATVVLADTNILLFRDIATHSAFLKYEMQNQAEATIVELKRLLSKAESERECMSRCLTIGEVYYHEKQYDSAWKYLKMVFDNSQSVNSRKQAAEWLVNICKTMERKEEAAEYADFVVPFATQDENNGTQKSQLTELCSVYKEERFEQSHKDRTIEQTKRSILAISTMLIVMLCFAFLYRKYKRKKKILEVQIKEEQYAHKMQQAALSDRLKHLKQTEQKALQQDETIKKLQSEFDATSKQAQQFQQALHQCLLEIYKSGEENRLERILAEFSTAYPQAMDNLRVNHPDLTETERNIVILSFLGFRTKEEAEILGLSPNTVEKYRTNIRKKTENKPFSDLIG